MTYSKGITQKKYVHIYTVKDISNHINTISSTYTHPLESNCAEKVLYKPREKRSVKRCVFRLFLKKERDGELRTFVGGEFQILAA